MKSNHKKINQFLKIKKMKNFELIFFCFGLIKAIFSQTRSSPSKFDIYPNQTLSTNYLLNNNGFLKKLKVSDRIYCISECVRLDVCSTVVLENSVICSIYINYYPVTTMMTQSLGTSIYIKQTTRLTGLMYYWPLINNYRDFIGGKDLALPQNAQFSLDRFNKPASALFVNVGQVFSSSNEIYFGNSFTFAFWINNIYCCTSNLFSVNTDQMIFGINYGVANFGIKNGFSLGVSSIPINRYKWYHLTFTYDGSKNVFAIYVNGLLGNIASFNGSSILGTSQYFQIGYYNPAWPAQGTFEDIKIYNRPLSIQEINTIMF